MTRQARQMSDSGIHHVMLRGINREPIFRDDEDRERFLQCLTITKALADCRVLAYCLMSNHVHLVLRTGGEDVGQAVKRLGVRYVGWHNRKYGRVGHLFQDRFKSRPVDDDEYLLTLLRYVWNNPVKAGLVQRPQEYRWSSAASLARPDGVIDRAELRALVPLDALVHLATESVPEGWVPKLVTEGRPLLTDADAADALRELCSAFRVGSLDELAEDGRRRIIAELLAHGCSIRQVARVTGAGLGFVRRVASEDAEWTLPG